MIAKVCSQKNKNRDYFSSGWCIKTISATCCLHRDRVQAKMSCQKCCIIDCVGDWLVGDWLVRGRVGVGVQCALCTACLCFSLCSLPCFSFPSARSRFPTWFFTKNSVCSEISWHEDVYIYKGTEREGPNFASFLVPFSSFWEKGIVQKKRNCYFSVQFLCSVPNAWYCFTVWKWGNPQCFHLPPGFWPMGGLGIVPVPHLTITSPLVNRLCSSRWNYRRCQSPHKGCRLALASKLIIREKPRLSPK